LAIRKGWRQPYQKNPLLRRACVMPSHLNVPTKYWELTKEIPPPPVERDINTWIIANPADLHYGILMFSL